MQRFAPVALSLGLSGCATLWQAQNIEKKVDDLIAATKRETLAEIFGDQAREISTKIDDLDQKEKERLDAVLAEYQRGSATLDEVRTDLLSVLGGSTRVVSGSRGIWVRDEAGDKLRTVPREGKIEKCRRLEPSELPAGIANNRRLERFTWGQGEVNGETVLFPWELTMSTFTKEIVENTARRTAQEFLRMSEGRGWRRPVYIKVITETPEDRVQISPPEIEEVYVVPGDEESGKRE